LAAFQDLELSTRSIVNSITIFGTVFSLVPIASLYSNKFSADAMALARRTISKLSFDYNADLL
jgi:hypothetical protein